MGRAVLTVVVAAGVLTGTPAASVQASVEVMVVGRSGETLTPPYTAPTRTRQVKVGRRRCTVGGRTPLAALAATRLPLTVTDQGSCGRSARDAGGLFVRAVSGQRNRGDDGWFYKVGRRAGTTGAGSPEGPFGNGRRLRDGQRVTWFYCRSDADGECQRTLELRPAAREAPAGGGLRVVVTGYDNEGRGVPVRDAIVSFDDGESNAVSGPDGVAVVPVPALGGATRSLSATVSGMIDAFPVPVKIR